MLVNDKAPPLEALLIIQSFYPTGHLITRPGSQVIQTRSNRMPFRITTSTDAS
jgi:hypothetical protein